MMGATYLNEIFSPFILIDTFTNFLFKHVLSTNIVLQVMKVNDESNHSILDVHEWSSCSHNHVLFSSFMITRFLCPRDYWSGGHIVLPLSVRPFVTLSMHSLSG